VLLQNHLGNFGLEALLEMPAIADEGVAITAQQLATVFSKLTLDEISCVRPALAQDVPIPNIGLLLFTTKPESPRAKGGALEFEVSQGKIIRLAFQHPTYRDFAQDISDNPERNGCKIEPTLLDKLR
jgi:hypothetical protein